MTTIFAALIFAWFGAVVGSVYESERAARAGLPNATQRRAWRRSRLDITRANRRWRVS